MPAKTAIVRPMTAQDAPLIAAWIEAVPLWQRYGLTAAVMRDRLEQALAHSDLLLTADSGAERACGVAWVVRRGAFGRSAYLRMIGVCPDRASSGIGAALLAGAEAAAGDQLFLLVSDFNVDAQRFYQRHGYTQIGAIPGFVLPDVTELIMWKRLGAAAP
jgi:ribosomal protein S18 acetylase RimI-like enzyme